MHIRSALVRLAGVACVFPLAACASLPRSPIPAALTDTEAQTLARNFLAEKGVINIRVDSIRPDKTGYLVAYETTFDAMGTPPKSWRLIDVNNDGAVRELEWNSTQR